MTRKHEEHLSPSMGYANRPAKSHLEQLQSKENFHVSPFAKRDVPRIIPRSLRAISQSAHVSIAMTSFRKLTRDFQGDYIAILNHYTAKPAPFKLLHRQLSTHLHKHVVKIGRRASNDIFAIRFPIPIGSGANPPAIECDFQDR